MNSAKVTIAIPSLNRVHYLRLALESALRQTYANLEVIVSDNASSDGTDAFLRSCDDPRIRKLRQASTLSMVNNWNACLQASTGDYFLLLSDDDLLEPEAIAKMVAAYEQNDDRVGFVYCRGRVIDAEGKILRIGQPSPPEESAGSIVLHLLEARRDTWPCSILFRRSDMGDGYSADFLLITDAAMWVQSVCRHGVALFLDEVLVNYRVHQNLTAKTEPQVWQQESAKFVEFAVRELEAGGLADPQLIQQIRKALARLNVRLVLDLPLAAPGKDKRAIFRQYMKHLPQFVSFYGVFRLTRALLVLWVPMSVRSGAKKFFNMASIRSRNIA